ncbi:MAG: hypothetical protein ACOX0N_04620 [Syntrophomonadaceae bacterium]|jgi:hypothetical protein|nr:hypothetical protein [Syntrophomonadaceae bacterium]
MSSALTMVIAAVFIVTILFGFLIIRQFGSFEKKALKAKQRQEEYIKEYLALKAEEERKRAEEEKRRAELADAAEPDQA